MNDDLGKTTRITRDDFINYEPIQVAAIVIRFYMMGNYGNLVYLDHVEYLNPDNHNKTQFVGSLSVAMQKKKDDGKGWEYIEPLKNAGTIILDNAFQIKSTTSKRTLIARLNKEYVKRGLKNG